jgi:hypothetical protein
MLPLLNAIYSAFTSAGALTAAFPGGMYRDQAPEGTAMPYLVSHVVQSAVEHAYAGVARSTVRIRFSAYGVGHDATGTLMNALTSEFDNAPLTLSSGTNDSVWRLDDPTPKLHHHDGLGNDVWEWAVTYEYGIRH